MSNCAGCFRPSEERYHSLATSTYCRVGLGQDSRRRLDDDRAVHAVRDVHEHRLRAAVVHEHARIVGAERVAHRLARHHVAERLVGGDPCRVEVDGVRDRAVVRERDLHLLALADVDDRTGSAAGPRPRRVLDAGSDLDRDVLQHEVHVRDRSRRRRRQRRGERMVGRSRAHRRSRARRRRSCPVAAVCAIAAGAPALTLAAAAWASSRAFCADEAIQIPIGIISAEREAGEEGEELEADARLAVGVASSGEALRRRMLRC